MKIYLGEIWYLLARELENESGLSRDYVRETVETVRRGYHRSHSGMLRPYAFALLVHYRHCLGAVHGPGSLYLPGLSGAGGWPRPAWRGTAGRWGQNLGKKRGLVHL